jgi:hypothetical protein
VHAAFMHNKKILDIFQELKKQNLSNDQIYFKLQTDKSLLGFTLNEYIFKEIKRENLYVNSEKDLVNDYNNKYNAFLHSEDYFKFGPPSNILKTRIALVRKPVDRFVSTYNMMVRTFVEKEKIPNYLEGILLDFDKFLNNFDKLMWEYTDFREHFKPQVRVLGLDPLWHTHIYNLKQYKELKQHLEVICGYSLPDIHFNKSTDKYLNEENLTQYQIDWIKEKFIIDYRIYGEYFK